MAGAVVPASSNFQQQGTVDWVELSGRSVQFSVAVLARLSKAGIDPFTLQVGRAICTNFSLHPIAQGRISDAILALKKFASYGDVIWFGFGVKHVVTDLAETEEGLALVAVCAALSTTYDSLYGARVLRELCGLCKAPLTFSPAIRQWKILVELCAGILTSSHFGLVLDGFRRLVSRGGNTPPKLETKRCPTTYSALAEAILTIAQVTTKRLASATFTGGLDCVWLAAVGEWVFSLDVIIYNSADLALYRSRSLDQQPPQITVVYVENMTEWEEQSFVSEKTSLIRSGRTLFVREDDNPLGDPHFFNWRSSWSTILHDTFHGAVDELLSGDNGYQFGLYLYCVSMIQEPDLRYKEDHDTPHLISGNLVEPLLWTQESSRGHKFLSFASKRLPELGQCLEHDFSSIPQNKVGSAGFAARNIFESECKAHCRNLSQYVGKSVCLRKLAEVIVNFLWITLVSDIEREITPSVTGLSNLYRRLDDNENQIGHRDDGGAQEMALVFHVLSGLSVDSEEQTLTSLEEQPLLPPGRLPSKQSSRYLAKVGAGICVYRQALEDPNLPPDSIFKFRVVPGYISHADAVFKRIRNLSGFRNPLEVRFDASSTFQSVDAIVQETDRDSELAMAYQVNFVDGRGQRKYLFLSVGLLLLSLQGRVDAFKCGGGCLDLPSKNQGNVQRLNMDTKATEAISSRRNTRKFPVVLFDQAATGNAQRFIVDLNRLSNMWIYASVKVKGDHVFPWCDQVEMLIDRPLVVYMALMNSYRVTLRVFRLTSCLSCMTMRGCLRASKFLREAMQPTGVVRLVAPGGTEEEMSWEILEPDFVQETVTVSSPKETQPALEKPENASASLYRNDVTMNDPNEQQHPQPGDYYPAGQKYKPGATEKNSPDTPV